MGMQPSAAVLASLVPASPCRASTARSCTSGAESRVSAARSARSSSNLASRASAASSVGRGTSANAVRSGVLASLVPALSGPRAQPSPMQRATRQGTRHAFASHRCRLHMPPLSYTSPMPRSPETRSGLRLCKTPVGDARPGPQGACAGRDAGRIRVGGERVALGVVAREARSILPSWPSHCPCRRQASTISRSRTRSTMSNRCGIGSRPAPTRFRYTNGNASSSKNAWQPTEPRMPTKRAPGVRFSTDSKDGFELRRDDGAPRPSGGGARHVRGGVVV